MKDLIGRKHRHLLWQDGAGDCFLLTSFCEIFRFSEDTLGLYILYTNKGRKLMQMPEVVPGIATDEPFWVAYAPVAILEKILSMETSKQRIHARGRKLKRLEKMLGHKILPYRPVNLRSRPLPSASETA